MCFHIMHYGEMGAAVWLSKLFKGGDVVDNITVNNIVSSTTFAMLHLPDELIQ
jgi:hypothetical protein